MFVLPQQIFEIGFSPEFVNFFFLWRTTKLQWNIICSILNKLTKYWRRQWKKVTIFFLWTQGKVRFRDFFFGKGAWLRRNLLRVFIPYFVTQYIYFFYRKTVVFLNDPRKIMLQYPTSLSLDRPRKMVVSRWCGDFHLYTLEAEF